MLDLRQCQTVFSIVMIYFCIVRLTLPECSLQFWHVGKINGIETVVAIQVIERNDSGVATYCGRVIFFFSCFQLVAFPFSVWYLVVAHFLRDAVCFVRVLNRWCWAVAFLLRTISVIIKIREHEVEEHRVRQNEG